MKARQCSRPDMDARAISRRRITLGIGAESGRGWRGAAAEGARADSPAHKPDQEDTEHGGRDARDAQRRLRTLERTRRQPFCGTGKGGEKQSFNDEHESDRGDELSHLCLTGAVMAKAAATSQAMWRPT